MRALTRISAWNRKVFQGFVSGYGFSHIETSATMMALAAAVAPDRRGIEFQIVAARMNACPSRNLLPPPPTHDSHPRRFWEGHEKSCPPVVPSHTVRRGTLEPYPDANRDYAFAACDKRVASSYIALKSERCRILSAPGSLRIWSSN